MKILDENAVEFVLCSYAALVSFVGKKILGQYEQRIQKTEDRQDKILNSLNNVEKQIVRIAVKLEDMGK